MPEPTALLLLPRLRVRNANAISGPLSHGFPPPSAFLGFAHALQRRLGDQLPAPFDGVGIVCHDFEPQVSQPNRRSYQVLKLTRNPIDKDGSTAAIVEEGRVHLEVTLLLRFEGYLNEDDRHDLAEAAQAVVEGMRLAGGSLLPRMDGRPGAAVSMLAEDTEGRQADFRKLRRRLLPGFALVQREDLLRQHLTKLRTEGEATALDALLDLCALHHEPAEDEAAAPDAPGESGESGADTPAEKAGWTVRRRSRGWLVPLPIGYAGISELYPPGQVANTRDRETPFRFVEALYSLGEWIGPHRLDRLEDLLWHTETDPEAGLYRCLNRYADTLTAGTAGGLHATDQP